MLQEAFQEEVRYVSPPWDLYRSLSFPGAEDLGNMFQYYHDCADAFASRRSVVLSESLNPELLSYGAWLADNEDRIPRE